MSTFILGTRRRRRRAAVRRGGRTPRPGSRGRAARPRTPPPTTTPAPGDPGCVTTSTPAPQATRGSTSTPPTTAPGSATRRPGTRPPGPTFPAPSPVRYSPKSRPPRSTSSTSTTTCGRAASACATSSSRSSRARRSVGAVRSAINRMTLRQNNWTLGAYCEQYCRMVTGHHTLEDVSMFPHLRRVAELRHRSSTGCRRSTRSSPTCSTTSTGPWSRSSRTRRRHRARAGVPRPCHRRPALAPVLRGARAVEPLARLGFA